MKETRKRCKQRKKLKTKSKKDETLTYKCFTSFFNDIMESPISYVAIGQHFKPML